MRNKKSRNLFARTALLLTALFLILITTAIGLFYYLFSIPEPEGMSIAHWPQDFTNSFSVWTTYQNGTLTIAPTGLTRLDEYGLWIQFIDESGEEIFSHNKPAGFPTKHSASALIALRTSEYASGYTIFVNSLEDSGDMCSYLVGFPYDIGKYMVHYNGARVARLSPVAKFVFLFLFSAFTFFAFGYSFWLSRNLSKVTGGIRAVSQRTYLPLKEKGMFREVYKALNKMEREVRHANQIAEETERTRREWITNITHDLKTPLSPVKGYAELLADCTVKERQDVQECGLIILKNMNHAEKLINDLKLTYQLDSGSIPYQPQAVHIVRYLKEWIIDIINDPAFSRRKIEFQHNGSELTALVDPDLFRRAIQNLVTNALLHNPPDTTVTITVDETPKKSICISICDNGIGISDAELTALFDRYYRGTNTKEKPEGSGLGLAIAKQIITLHGGDITVSSKLDAGTTFVITLPVSNESGKN